MKKWVWTTLLASMLAGGLVAEIAPAAAEQSGGGDPIRVDETPQTLPPDLGYGTREVDSNAYFPHVGPPKARVDRRGEINPLADRNVLWPTAHTLEAGTWAYSNYVLLGHQLSYAASDDLLVSLGVVLPYENTYGQASAKWLFHRSQDLTVALVPFGLLRVGTRDFSSTDFGGGLGLVADVTPADSLVLSGGLMGYGTLYYRYYEVDYSGCASRTEFADGACIEGTPFSRTTPGGGHWLAAYAGLTYYAFERVFFNAELTYGAATGSFLGTETLLDARVERELETRRFLDGEWAAGIPYGRGLSGGFGITGAYRNFAAQFSVYMIQHGEGDNVRVEGLPVFTASLHF